MCSNPCLHLLSERGANASHSSQVTRRRAPTGLGGLVNVRESTTPTSWSLPDPAPRYVILWCFTTVFGASINRLPDPELLEARVTEANLFIIHFRLYSLCLHNCKYTLILYLY